MSNLSKEDKCGIEIYDYTGDNYKTAIRFGAWRIAYLNHGDIFAEENFKRIERHMESDEAFILLSGKATLLIGREMAEVEMEPHKLYNVPKGVWHHIFTYEGTSVLIVENEDTSPENSEYLYKGKDF